MKLIAKHAYSIIGIALGSIAGFAYWKFVGCASGSCPITSSPFNSTLYGAFMGVLFLHIIKDLRLKK